MRWRGGNTGEVGREGLAYLDALYNLARHLTGSDPEAEDLVQETYARAFAAAPSFAPGTNLRAWLFQILRNAFLDQTRKRKNVPQADAEDEPQGDTGGEVWLGDDPELDRLRGLVARDVEAALRTLSEAHRMIVLLDVAGLSETEVAQILAVPVGTVTSRLARARAALRDELKDYAK